MAIFGKILDGDPWFGPLVVIRKCEWADRSDWRGLLAVKLWGNWHAESDRNCPVYARMETDDVNQTRWLTSDDLPRVIASCLFLYSILTVFFWQNNDLFICGHPNQDVGGELILDCKVEDLEVLHEYFRPRGCIKYCLWEDKTLDHLARVKELMGLDESRGHRELSVAGSPDGISRYTDSETWMRYASTTVLPPQQPRTVHSEFFLWTNKIPRLVFIPSDAVCSWTMHRIAPKQHIGHRWSTSPITQHSTTSTTTFRTWRPSRNSSGICARRK